MSEKNTDYDVEYFIGYLLKRVSSRAMATLLEMLNPLGLRITETTVLHRIASQPEITASDIGRSLGIKRANMTPLVSRLTELGYIRVSVQDGRSQGLDLTKSGWQIYRQTKAVLESHDETAFSMLNNKERAQLFALLNKVYRG